MKGKDINLVLAGGGVKGIALVGAITALEEAGYKVHRVAGTSAGAIVGGLLAVGFSNGELRDIMRELDYTRFGDKSLIARLGPPGQVAALIFEKGIYKGDYFCKWYDELLAQKSVHTFGEVKSDEDYRFAAFAADISRGQLVRFPDDLALFDIDPDGQLISEAVRASISVPFYYRPVTLGGNYLVDGGILSNFPMHAFRGSRLPTIGVKLSAQPGAVAQPHRIKGPISYGVAVFNTMLSVQDQAHMEDESVVEQTIFVDTGKILATDFDISRPQQQALFDAGYEAATKYLAR